MPRVVPGQKLGGAALAAQGAAAFTMAATKLILDTIFPFHLFPKSKRPLQISFGSQKQVLL